MPDADAISSYIAIAAATLGPVATIGAIWARFQRLHYDVREHLEADRADFRRVYEQIGLVRERLAALESRVGHE